MKAEEFNDSLARLIEAFIAKAEGEDPVNVSTTYLQVTNNQQENGVTYIIHSNVTVTFSTEEEPE